ncbi:MAG: hypothetical protein LIQ30_08045 [Planctomycetes bacterium]|nr:hypothetical protein [Planctomycetota bacterium]
MSLSAIQDNLVKTSLVQHTQSRGEDIKAGSENAAVAKQHEVNRQEDQVVIHTRESEGRNIRDDEERPKDERRKKQEDDEEMDDDETVPEGEEDDGPRARMRRINIVI